MKGFTQSDIDISQKNEVPTKSYFPFGIKATFHHGAISSHRAEVNEIIEGHTQAYELSFYKTTMGNKKWQQSYNYPKTGFSALAMNLGNKKELGMGFGIFPFIELPINQRKINWRFKIGYGLGYIEKPFDRKTNYKNVAIGSNFNALIYANLLWEIKLAKALNTSMGLSLIHFSNGSFERPNLGINIFSLNTGVTYSFGEKKVHVNNKIEERPHKWSKKITIGIGLKEIPPADGKKYVVSTCSFNFMKTRAEKSSFGFGTDLFYNSSLSDLNTRDSASTSNSFDNIRVGIAGMYSFDFGKVSVSVAMGGYLFSNYKGNGLIYNRLETRYSVSDKLFLRFAMKTHIAVADFLECGVGYNF
ncbi:MAG: hypothetical protein COB15_03820 [Flavobacteriales bacterium]|nr:MAG: hypothetical protein COB15_03820 [Flavobacteriales bacterium]